MLILRINQILITNTSIFAGMNKIPLKQCINNKSSLFQKSGYIGYFHMNRILYELDSAQNKDSVHHNKLDLFI